MWNVIWGTLHVLLLQQYFSYRDGHIY